MKPPRKRSRYAPDKEATRAAELALRLGVKLKLGADGSVEVLGRLDSPPPAGLASTPEGGDDAEDAERWFQEDRVAGH